MLVLSRKIGQKLIIDHHTQVVVLDIRGDVVKFGVEAPRNVSIYREELYEAIKAENQANHGVQPQSVSQALRHAPKKRPAQNL